METGLFRKEALLNQASRKTGHRELRSPAPIVLLLWFLLAGITIGAFFALNNSHIYSKKFTGLIAPSQYEYAQTDGVGRGPLDAYIFIPEHSIHHLVIGQTIEVTIAGRRHAHLPPLAARVESIINPEDIARNDGEESRNRNSVHMVVASLSGGEDQLGGNIPDLRPGMALFVAVDTEEVTWSELLLQPLRKLTNPG